MAAETERNFSWGLCILACLGLGALVTVLFAVAGMSLQSMFFEILLAPGFRLAVLIYGGLHGGEPILLGFLVDTLLYSVLSFVVIRIRFRRISPKARS
jgi:hypothetical protein